MKTVFLIAGLLAVIIGLLWVGQGLDYIRWPARSFMIRQNNWAIYGGVLAAVGFVMIWFSRR
jgi:hypothetical protein